MDLVFRSGFWIVFLGVGFLAGAGGKGGEGGIGTGIGRRERGKERRGEERIV